MAGTRLLLIGVFVVQFFALIVLALTLANNPSYFGSNGASILVDRNGISILQTSNSDGDGATIGGRNPVSSILTHRLVELRQRVDAVHYPLDFHLLSSVGTIDIDGMDAGRDCRTEGNCDSVEEEDGRLRDAFRLGLETTVTGSEEEGEPLDIRVLAPLAESRRVAGTCDDITARFGASTSDNSENDSDAKTINERMGYDILVSRGCTDASLSIGHDAKLSVDELGDMLLSIREGSSITDIENIIKDDVASFIVKEFVFLSHSHATDHNEEYNNDDGKSSWVESTSTLEVVITLLDEDPFSYTDTSTNSNNNNNTSSSTSSKSKHNHHNQLHQSLSTTVSTYLQPLLNSRLAPLLDKVHIGTQSHPYRATTTTTKQQHPTRQTSSLSHQSTKANNKNNDDDYILDISKARDVFLTDDPADAAGDGNFGVFTSLVMDQRNTWTAATTVGNADDVSVTLNLVVYVPPMDRMPLKVKFKSGGGGGVGADKVVSYGTAFSIPERFTAVSIVNLNKRTVATGSDDEDHNDHYDKTVTNALSYFGTFLRTSLGLPILQPHRHSPSILPSMTTSTTGKGRVLLNHVASPYGMTQWEVDKLLRTYWKGKAEEIVNRLENVLELVDWKKDIAFPIESAQKVNSCLQHLHDALNLIDNKKHNNNSNRRDIRQSTRSLNAAHRIATALSIDGDMVPLPDFPMEQLLALLGSMTVPLILPFIIGVLKEYKRYRTLVAKKEIIGVSEYESVLASLDGNMQSLSLVNGITTKSTILFGDEALILGGKFKCAAISNDFEMVCAIVDFPDYCVAYSSHTGYGGGGCLGIELTSGFLPQKSTLFYKDGYLCVILQSPDKDKFPWYSKPKPTRGRWLVVIDPRDMTKVSTTCIQPDYDCCGELTILERSRVFVTASEKSESFRAYFTGSDGNYNITNFSQSNECNWWKNVAGSANSAAFAGLQLSATQQWAEVGNDDRNHALNLYTEERLDDGFDDDDHTFFTCVGQLQWKHTKERPNALAMNEWYALASFCKDYN